METIQTLDSITFSKVDLFSRSFNKPIDQITRYDLIPSAYLKLKKHRTAFIEINGEKKKLK